MKTDPENFKVFHNLLMENAPDNYTPWYFPVCKNNKNPDAIAIKNISNGKTFSWKDEKARLSYKQAYDRLKAGYNVGIAARAEDNLFLIDIDNYKYKDEMPNGLIDVSRKRCGFHGYFFMDIEDKKTIGNLPTDEDGEIRCIDQYVVAPGSFVETNPEDLDKENLPEDVLKTLKKSEDLGKYTVKENNPARYLSYHELPKFFKIALEQKTLNNTEEDFDKNSIKKNSSKLFSLRVSDIVNTKTKTRTAHPLHESDTGANWGISPDGAIGHCWRHNVSLNAIQFLAVKYGFCTCQEAGKGHKNSGVGESIVTKDKKLIKKIWEKAKEEGLIPEDDPEPFKYKKKKRNNNSNNFGIDYDVIYENISDFLDKIPYIYDDVGMFWRYDSDKKYYSLADDVTIIKDLISVFGAIEALPSLIRNAYLVALKTQAREKYDESFGENDSFTKDKIQDFVQFKSTIINVRNGEKIDADASFFSVNVIPWELGKSDRTPLLDSLFEDWCPGKKETLKDIIAYSCLNHNNMKMLFFLHGPKNTGKSQFNTIVARFLGYKNIYNSNFNLLSDSTQRFELVNLRNKLAVFCSELDDKSFYKTSSLKQISGMDDLRGEYKGVQKPVSFKFRGKAFIATNTLPTVEDTSDDAFFGRCVIIDFLQTFKPGMFSPIDSVSAIEYQNLAKYCMNRINTWREKGYIELTGVPEFEERIKIYKEKSNPLISFMDDFIEFDECPDPQYSDFEINSYDFYNEFNVYLQSKGFKKWDNKKIGIYLKKEYKDKVAKKQKRVGEDRYWFFTGMKLKEKTEVIKDSLNKSKYDISRLDKINKSIEYEFDQCNTININMFKLTYKNYSDEEVHYVFMELLKKGYIMEKEPNEFERIL